MLSGGEENERQMVNNVNCKEMRFVIRNLVDVDDVSSATAPKIPFDVCLNYVSISPKRKGLCSTTTVCISLSDETMVIEPVGEPRNTM